MAFRFGDPGGRMYAAAGTSGVNILANWTSSGNIGQWAVSAGNGRTTGSSLRATNWNGTQNLSKTLSSSVQTLGGAMALRFSVLPGAVAQIMTFLDSGTIQVDLRLNTNGTLTVTRNGTTLGTSSAAISANVYNHIEMKAKIDPSVGTIEVRLNGVSVIGPLTSQNTRNTANSTVNGFALHTFSAGSGTASIDYDDIIVWDTTTTDAAGNTDISDFIGDCSLTWILPTGAGTTTQFTPDSGSNYARVNEATPDGDTSYVQDATVTDIDTYAMADLGSNASVVKSIAVCHYAKKTDSGARGMKAEIRTGATNYAFANEIALATSYQYYQSVWGQNPNTVANWTVSDINGLESGQTVSS